MDPIAWLMAEMAMEEMQAGKVRYISALLLDGPPGCEKSFLAKYLAHKLEVEFIAYAFTDGCGRADILFDTDNAEREMIPGIIPKTVEMSHHGPVVVLLLDEIDKAECRVESFFLLFFNDGEIFILRLELLKSKLENWPDPDVELIELKVFAAVLPEFPEDGAKILIRLANKLRKDPRTFSPPATPEIVGISSRAEAMRPGPRRPTGIPGRTGCIEWVRSEVLPGQPGFCSAKVPRPDGAINQTRLTNSLIQDNLS